MSEDHYIYVLDGGNSDKIIDYIDRLRNYRPIVDYSNWQISDESIHFCEPDLNNQITAVAVNPNKIPTWIRSLPLLFSKGGVNND